MVIRVVVEAGGRPAASTSERDHFGPRAVPEAVLGDRARRPRGASAALSRFVVPAVFLAVRWCVVPQAVVIDGARGTEALRRSWSLVQGRGWWTLAALVVANLLTTVLSVVFTVPGRLLARAVDAEAVNLAGGVLGQIATLPLLGIATTLLYFTLRAGDEAGRWGRWRRRRRRRRRSTRSPPSRSPIRSHPSPLRRTPGSAGGARAGNRRALSAAPPRPDAQPSSALRSSAQELMQKRWPPRSRGPSSKTWPRWPPQRAQMTSVRVMPCEMSVVQLDRLGDRRLGEARPARARVELGRRS